MTGWNGDLRTDSTVFDLQLGLKAAPRCEATDLLELLIQNCLCHSELPFRFDAYKSVLGGARGCGSTEAKATEIDAGIPKVSRI
jgi:hypothetical protein